MAGELIATNIPARSMHTDRVPEYIDGKADYYCHGSETEITGGTWAAILSSLATAQSAQRHVAAGARAAIALCLPSGHHATADQYVGYCFINNAAVVAQMFVDNGAKRVAILDIDFHHGNGTQDIFYERDDVIVAPLHGAPQESYPHFLGYADETGRGAGEGLNLTFPMTAGTGYGVWSATMDEAIAKIKAWGAEALVVSLGVDAYKEDTISFFTLDSPDFIDAGRKIGAMDLPTVFCMEGGYLLREVVYRG